MEPDEKGEAIIRMQPSDETPADDALSLTVEGDEGEPAGAEISLQGEEELPADDGEGEELEPGSRAQKRIEALVGVRNRLEREVVPQLRSKLAEAAKSIEALTAEMAAVEAKPPKWFEDLYGGFDEPENTARFDAAIVGILDEKEFRDDPKVKAVLDRAVAELKKRGMTVTKPVAKPDAKLPADAPVAEDWTARSLVETSVKAVLKRANVRPELQSVLTDAVTPALLKESATSKAMPAEKSIVDAISAHVKALGWKPEFYRAPSSDKAPEVRPNTRGVGGAVTVPAKPAKKADPAADAAAKGPQTPAEADELRRSKLRSLIGALPAGKLEEASI